MQISQTSVNFRLQPSVVGRAELHILVTYLEATTYLINDLPTLLLSKYFNFFNNPYIYENKCKLVQLNNVTLDY